MEAFEREMALACAKYEAQCTIDSDTVFDELTDVYMKGHSKPFTFYNRLELMDFIREHRVAYDLVGREDYYDKVSKAAEALVQQISKHTMITMGTLLREGCKGYKNMSLDELIAELNKFNVKV